MLAEWARLLLATGIQTASVPDLFQGHAGFTAEILRAVEIAQAFSIPQLVPGQQFGSVIVKQSVQFMYKFLVIQFILDTLRDNLGNTLIRGTGDSGHCLGQLLAVRLFKRIRQGLPADKLGNLRGRPSVKNLGNVWISFG